MSELQTFLQHAETCNQCDDQAWSGCLEGKRLYDTERKKARQKFTPDCPECGFMNENCQCENIE